MLVHFSGHGRIQEERLELASEGESLPIVVVVEGFDPNTVSRDQEALRGAVVECEGEFAAQCAHQLVAFIFVEMEHDLCIAGPSESVTARYQPSTNIAPAVELSVDGQPQGAVLIAHRLVPARARIHDRESSMPEPGATLTPHALVVGAAMAQDGRLRSDQIRQCATATVVIDADYSANDMARRR